MRLLTGARRARRRRAPAPAPSAAAPSAAARATTIGDVVWRQRATVAGRVRSLRVQPWGEAPTLECTVVDHTGGLAVVFLGRREVAGIRPGTRLVATGIIGAHHGRLAMLNPVYELLPPGE